MGLQPSPTQPVGVSRKDPITALVEALTVAAKEAEKQAEESNYSDYIFVLPWTWPTKKRIERAIAKFNLVAAALKEAGAPPDVIGRYATESLKFEPVSTSYFIKVYTVVTPEMEKNIYSALRLSGFLLQHRVTRPTARKVMADLYSLVSKYDASVGGILMPPNLVAAVLRGDAASVTPLIPFASVVFRGRT